MSEVFCYLCGKKIKKRFRIRTIESPKDTYGISVVICKSCYLKHRRVEYE